MSKLSTIPTRSIFIYETEYSLPSLSLSLSLSLYIYIYIYVYMCVYTYIYTRVYGYARAFVSKEILNRVHNFSFSSIPFL